MPAKLVTLFAVLTSVPLAALAWLGWSLVAEERNLDHQRLIVRLQQSASLLAGELDRSLDTWDTALGTALQRPFPQAGAPAQTTLILFDPSGVVRTFGVPLPYYPAVAATDLVNSALFAEAEADEFGVAPKLGQAEAAYLQLARTSTRPIRAEALMRLARCLKKDGKSAAALDAYAELAALEDVEVAGSPAELVGRAARMQMYQASGDRTAAAHEMQAIAASLESGHFSIDRATFDLYAALAPLPHGFAPTTVATAEAAERLWPQWHQGFGRLGLTTDAGALVSLWRNAGSRGAALIGPMGDITRPAEALARRLDVAFALDDAAGRPVWGALTAADVVTRSARETGSPWTLRVGPTDLQGADTFWRSRRLVYASMFLLLLGIVETASYVVYRAVKHELEVARLQSDFVAAISHEFRTPLTAVCHLTAMLEEGTASPDKLPEFYRAIGREGRRLAQMVENLLDFGRMESAQREYCMEDTDLAGVVRDVVDEFRAHGLMGADRLVLAGPAAVPRVRADRQALALAIRNLVDNAIKYSPATSPVTVTVDRFGDAVGLSVADRGPGIPPQEQSAIFRKFVRGSSAATYAVKGTGLGLAMVDRIVRAHRGKVDLWSEVGVGSRFTIRLPAGVH